MLKLTIHIAKLDFQMTLIYEKSKESLLIHFCPMWEADTRNLKLRAQWIDTETLTLKQKSGVNLTLRVPCVQFFHN